MDKPLDQKVRDLLLARRGKWTDISIAADVSHSWISKFVNGHIPNPGYGRLARLVAHLELSETGESSGPALAHSPRTNFEEPPLA